MAMVKSFFFLLSTALVLFVLEGCCSGPETIHQDDLEKRCGSLPCGVTLVSGNASIVTTYHAGEHGLRLEQNSVIRMDRDALTSTPAPLKVDAHLQVLLLCDEGTGLDVVLGSEDQNGPSEASLTGVPSPASDTEELPTVTFPIPVPGFEVLNRPLLQFLQFTTVGPGGCTIDDIWVFVPNLCQG